MGRGAGREKRWSKPEVGVVKLNVDADTKEGWGTGLGAVCRDSRGEVQWGFTEVSLVVMEPREAEALAVLEGVKEAAKKEISKIVVESDCKGLMDALKAKEQGRSDFHLIVADI
ncbi:uncharacterized protein LOC141613286 [Silene latifolia]|uniref:uncharacterized protein LOC141613286 n=1 Tax=Silene latifolia TaxID=37657 RepID=UPI003D772CAF